MKKMTLEEWRIQVLKKALKIEDEGKSKKKKKSPKKDVEILSLDELNK